MQVRDYISSQRSRVRKLARLSHEKATKWDASKTSIDDGSSVKHSDLSACKGIAVNTHDLRVLGDCTQSPANSGNSTSVLMQFQVTPLDAIPQPIPLNAIPVSTQLPGNPNNLASICSQVPGNSGNFMTTSTPVPPECSVNATTVCTQVHKNFVNATTASMSAPGNSGNLTTVFTPIIGYSGIANHVGTLVPGSFINVTPVQNGQTGSMKISLKPVEDGPSCPSQEATPGMDSDDRKFLENIFSLMRKEQAFSGRLKLMEWVLQIHNSAVLSWYLTQSHFVHFN